MQMSPETSFALIVLSAVFSGSLGFLWWFFRDTNQRLEARVDKFIDDLGEFKSESVGDRAALGARLALIDEKINTAIKKSEEHSTMLLLLLPRIAVLEDELAHQRREDPPSLDVPPEPK